MNAIQASIMHAVYDLYSFHLDVLVILGDFNVYILGTDLCSVVTMHDECTLF